MIAIFLGILKWIGVVLVSVLGILLLLLLLVLFVPIRYNIRFQRTGLETEPAIEIKGKVSWLLSFLRIIIRYPAEIYLRVKVIFFTVFSMPDPKQEKKKEKKKTKKSAEHEHMEDNHSADDETAMDDNIADDNIADDIIADERNSANEKTSILTKIKKMPEVIQKIKEKLQFLKDKIESGQAKAEDLNTKIEYYQGVFESRNFREAFALCKKELLGILKSISPKKIDVYLEIGWEDPASTATILSYYGMFYPWIYDKVRLVGNFEEKIIKANGIIKGQIRIATILFAGVRVYFNKNIRKLLRMMKKEEHQNGRK